LADVRVFAKISEELESSENVFVTVRAQMSHEREVINREEAGEAHESGATPTEHDDSDSPIEDAQSDVEKTFLVVGAAALVAALVAGYLVAARTAAPLRRFAGTAAAVGSPDIVQAHSRADISPDAIQLVWRLPARFSILSLSF